MCMRAIAKAAVLRQPAIHFHLQRPSLLRCYASWTKTTVVEDPFFKQAKRDGYVSRAAYKLKEIQQKHRIIKPSGKVLDLGCSPGAWLQVSCQEIGHVSCGGAVLGIDIQPVALPPRFCDQRVKVIQADARTLSPEILEQHAPGGFDTILSDMLHFTSGVNDVELSLELAGTALNIATGHYFQMYGEEYAQRMGFSHTGFLRPGGNLVMKVYEGAGVADFMREMQGYFCKVVRMRVDASRSQSREFYAVGLGRKAPRGAGAGGRGGGGGEGRKQKKGGPAAMAAAAQTAPAAPATAPAGPAAEAPTAQASPPAAPAEAAAAPPAPTEPPRG